MIRVPCLLAAAMLGATGACAATDPNFQAPPGFEVALYAGDDLAHDIFSLTVDARGRVVVAGKGYVNILHDDDGDGRADRAWRFSDLPKSGAHGLYFDGPDLLCTGDNALMRLRDADADGRADGEPQILAVNVKHSEHGANGLVKGPDGWLYNICGNDAGINASHAALPGSPVLKPSQGAVVRLSPDGRGSQVVAHGFRNPYDLDFDALGRMFTVDADGERDHHLPWYAPNRLFDIAVGQHHGWMIGGWQRSWNRPEYFPDNVARLVEIGRGSPTGLLCYRHRRFPARYRQGVFSICWTFGTVYFFPTQPQGASYAASMETFLQTTGSVGFAPVDLAVGPEGDLFVAIGGRGTRGGVYRVRYVGDSTSPAGSPAPPAEDPIASVLDADQPLSSWSRARWVPQAMALGRRVFLDAAQRGDFSAERRLRAIEVLTELFGGLDADAARAIGRGADPLVAARAAWSLAYRPGDDDALRVLAGLTAHADVAVQRAAWEALLFVPRLPEDKESSPAWARALAGGDRRVRAAALALARGAGRASFIAQTDATLGSADVRFDLANLWFEGVDPANGEWTEIYAHAAATVFSDHRDPALRLEAVRLLQLALGDVRVEPGANETETGYSARAPDRIDPRMSAELARVLGRQFPTRDRVLDYEVARTLAMLRATDPALPAAVASRWTDDSPPNDDVHYLLVMAQLKPASPVPAQVTTRAARTLARLHAKMDARQWRPSRFWPMWVTEAFARIARFDPALPAALVADPDFGRAEHAAFIPVIEDPAVRRDAAARLLQTAEQSTSPDAWTPELAAALGDLPDAQLLPALRRRFDDPRLRDAIAPVLAQRGDGSDRARLLEAVESSNPRVVQACAKALAGGDKGGAQDMARLLRALSRHEADKPATAALTALLTAWSGQSMAAPAQGKSGGQFAVWHDWFSRAHPDHAARLADFGPVDAQAWASRLAGIDWAAGEVARGRVVFQQRLCAACHEGPRRFGPELRGAGRRFSREDYFAQIIHPSASIAPTYQALQITLRDGTVHVGSPIYQSPDSTILQIGVDTTVRITGDQVAGVEPARRSPMPAGLLAGLSDAELADLYAYLSQLK
jgi:putative membrane-bound dehydrogenase-like protein